MSLDIYLKVKGKTVFDSNITHNLNKMASACGVYYACWHPYMINATKAEHIIPVLKDGVKLLEEHPDFYKKFDSPNGWGLYVHFLPWLKEVLGACEKYPKAKLHTST